MASNVLRSLDLVAAITAYQDGLTKAMAEIQTLADAIQLTPAGFDRRRHLVNVPAHIAALPYLERYTDPTTKLSTHALFVSPTEADSALALHLSIVQGNLAIVQRWRRHDAALVTSGTLELAAAASQGPILQCLFENYPELATPKMMDLVAMSGDLALLRWLHDAGAICTTDAMDGAAMHGHLDVVIFLHEARTEGCTVAAVTAAVANGHADVVRYLLDHRTERVDAMLYYNVPHSDHKTYSVAGTKYLEAIDLAAATTTLHEIGMSPMIERLGLPALEHIYASGYQRITPRCLEVALLRHDHSMLSFALNALSQEHASIAGEWQPLDEDDETLEINIIFGLKCWRDCAVLDTAAFRGDLTAIQLLHASRLRCATERAMMYAACNGHLEVLQWLHAHRKDGCSAEAMALAAARGHTDVVYWLLNVYQLPPTNAVLASAAATGNLSLVQYLLSWLPGANDDVGDGTVIRPDIPSLDLGETTTYGEYFDGRPTDWAIRCGHLEVLQCLVAYGYRVSWTAMNDAVQYGHLDVMVYLHDAFGQRCTSHYALLMAVCHHSIDVLAYALLHQNIWATTDDPDDRALDVHILCVYVARRGDVAILDLVATTFDLDFQRDLPRRVQERMLVRVAARGHLEMLRCLVQTHGFEWTSAVESAARTEGRKSVLGFLATRGPAVPSAYAIGDVALTREAFDRSRRRAMVDGNFRVQPM